jgi:hypothetical protein
MIGDPEPACKSRASGSPGWNQLAFLEAKSLSERVGRFCTDFDDLRNAHMMFCVHVSAKANVRKTFQLGL